MDIPYSKQDINFRDRFVVWRALKSKWLTQGPAVPEFEEALATRVKARYGVAVNSATSALHVALIALGVQKGDRVWTSPVTFAATANAALYCGAEVEFIDIDESHFGICVTALRRKLEDARGENLLPKVVIPVHLAGQPCDMRTIRELGNEFGFRILEDASHALGSSFEGSPTGSCQFSDITVFSFHPVKMITTGEGGMAVTNDKLLADKMKLLRSHGITREPSSFKLQNSANWYYEQHVLGFNYRMTDFQARLGLNQLKRLTKFVTRRNMAASYYNQLGFGSKIQMPMVRQDRTSSFHLFIISVPSGRDALANELSRNGIQVSLHYIPIYRHPFYSESEKYNPSDFPNSESFYKSALSIPLFTSISRKQLRRVRNTCVEVLEKLDQAEQRT